MPRTNIKYLLEFNSVKTGVHYLLQIIDTVNDYDTMQFPMQLQGSDAPVKKSYNNTDDSPYLPILASQLDIVILIDKTFATTDFSQATDRQWKINYFKDGRLDFQGYLISTEIGQNYSDAPQQFKLTAVDGLSTLKGKPLQQVTHISTEFLDTYVVNELPFYGLYKITDFFFYCLYKLGYDYGRTTLFSSLRFVSSGDSSQPIDWSKVLLWSDQFFDDSGEPDDCYAVLEKILRSFGLQIVQDSGSFTIRHPNDTFYIGLISQQAVINSSSVSFNYSFENSDGGSLPSSFQVGFDMEAKPVNPGQSITYDVAYNKIRGKLTFKTSAYIYPDPGFENGIVNGLPLGFKKIGNIDAVILSDINTSYEGLKYLRIRGLVFNSGTDYIDNSLGYPNGFYVEAGKVINFSLVFRPIYFSDKYNSVPRVALIYMINGNNYFYNFGSNNWVKINGGLDGDLGLSPNLKVTDYVGYTQFSFSTTPAPESGIGKVFTRFYSPLAASGGSIGGDFPPDDQLLEIQIDQFQITAVNAADAYSKLVGEVHQATNNTNYALAEVNETEFDIYTSLDKRLTGSALYGTNYIDSISSPEMWLYKLSYPNAVGGFRLTEALVFQYEKMYQRPMMMWDGDIYTDSFSILNLPILRFYENKKFIILNAEIDYRSSIITIRMREFNDLFYDYTYKYIPNFEKSARKVVN